MRNFIYAGIIFTLFINSCEKQEDEVSTYYWGEASALKNQTDWSSNSLHANYNVYQPDNLDFFADVHNSNEVLRERLSFFNIPIVTENSFIYHLEYDSTEHLTGAAYTTICCDGDVVEDRFIVLDNDTNYIELTSINSETGEIKGNFEVTFVRDPDDDITNASLPDTIHFTDGTFNTKILDE